MLIAVASKSGEKVDQHFGHAQKFTIYDYTPDECKKLKEVDVDKYCSFEPGNPFRHNKFDAIGEALKGCSAVVSVMIGEYPREELKKRGIMSITYEGTIEDGLKVAYGTLEGVMSAI